MAILRQYIAPLFAVVVFLLSLVAVSARIFLPEDMAAPAPIEAVSPAAQAPSDSGVIDSSAIGAIALDVLVEGLPITAPPLNTSL
jgi:hypothetical protein